MRPIYRLLCTAAVLSQTFCARYQISVHTLPPVARAAVQIDKVEVARTDEQGSAQIDLDKVSMLRPPVVTLPEQKLPCELRTDYRAESLKKTNVHAVTAGYDKSVRTYAVTFLTDSAAVRQEIIPDAQTIQQSYREYTSILTVIDGNLAGTDRQKVMQGLEQLRAALIREYEGFVSGTVFYGGHVTATYQLDNQGTISNCVVVDNTLDKKAFAEKVSSRLYQHGFGELSLNSPASCVSVFDFGGMSTAEVTVEMQNEAERARRLRPLWSLMTLPVIALMWYLFWPFSNK